jgi:DNA-binding HxlR family transcriptional regulator
VRELLHGPRRYTDLAANLPNIGTNILASRLKSLEACGIVSKRRLPPPAASQVYELTAAGLALEPVVIALGRWGGANLPRSPEGTGMSLDAAMLSFPTLFDAALAGDLDATVLLRVGAERFVARVAEGRFSIERGDAAEFDAAIDADPRTLLDVAHGRRELDDALESGDLRIEGDVAVGRRFLGLFPIPAAAA